MIEELEAEIDALQAEYHKLVSEGKTLVVDLEEKVNKLLGLKTDLHEMIADGAHDCPDCGAKAIGRHKTKHPEYDIFEVGCPSCPTRSRGPTPEKAVERWNARMLYKEPEVIETKAD